jgi:serine/threonine protein kinase
MSLQQQENEQQESKTDLVSETLVRISGGGSSSSELKLINQGTYGCIFHPGINCSGKKENIKYLTKIQKNAKTIENEVFISNLVRSISGYTRFFAPILKQCPVKIAKQYQNEMKQCRLFEDLEPEQLHKQTYVSNKIRYVGNTNINDHIMNQSTLKQFWKEILETHTYLSKALQKLEETQIVHYDIKYNNIMFDTKLNKPVFIDFGISIHLPSLNQNNLRDAFYVFDTYPYWSFDVCVCNYIFRELTFEKAISTKITESELERIFNVFVYGYEDSTSNNPKIHNDIFNNSVFPMDSIQLIEQYKKTVFKYYTAFIGQTWYSLYNHYISQNIWKSWDTYSLAVVYLFIVDDYLREHTNTFEQIQSQTHTAYNSYIELLFTIIFAPPDQRYTPSDTIKSLKTIIGQIQALPLS